MPENIEQIIDQVDPTKPIRGNATTESVRLNFEKIKQALIEINAYGEDLSGLFSSELDVSVFEQYKTNSRFYLDISTGVNVDTLITPETLSQTNPPLEIPSPVISSVSNGITYDTIDRSINFPEIGLYVVYAMFNLNTTGSGLLEYRAATRSPTINGGAWTLFPTASRNLKQYSTGTQEIVDIQTINLWSAGTKLYLYVNPSNANLSFVTRNGTSLQNPDNPLDIQTTKRLGIRIQVARIA